MKTINEVMTSDVVWVSPNAAVKTAVILMKGHEFGALPVVSTDESVVGLVTYQGLLGSDPSSAIADVMISDYPHVAPDATIYEAAVEMNRTRLGYLLVLNDGKLAGILSQGDIIPELGKNFDPLTELPYSDSFREWAMEALKSGTEISVALFDLDNFGVFNKKHGHVIGDRILQGVAEVFRNSIDPSIELACRYGGDEFAIVSTRHADDTIELADVIKARISQVRVDGLDDPVTGSYGLAGGRRTQEREDTHYAATIDDLITRASKLCEANKPRHKAVAAAQSETRPEIPPLPIPEEAPSKVAYGVPSNGRGRLRISKVSFASTGAEASVSVSLVRGEQEFLREASGYILAGKNILRLVAEATAGAACKSLAPDHGIVVEDVLIQSSGQDEEIVTVLAVFISPRYTTRSAGSAVVKRGDQFRAAAAALLAAVNRQLEITPATPVEEAETALL